ncbi:MAG: hypothetical protein K9K40_02505 [Desulfotignum sp.]|nr:hypothetical protein [Desulfotignum sp.]MCF8125213.1 hypothetical protein [Desulfotignum sp.]
MQEIQTALNHILCFLKEKRGVDFNGYHPDMLLRRIKKRITDTNCRDFTAYLSHLEQHADEIDLLLDVITINVSRFFRDTLTFELLADRTLPQIVMKKARSRDYSLRIWSAGCAMGEEPYSVAILVHELLNREGVALNRHLFATDIDTRVLQAAARAVYPFSSIENIKYRLLKKYFLPKDNLFLL